VRQVVHHVPDSHLNAYTRFKLALTEDTPTIKTYEEARWAELPEARSAPIDASLALLGALHERGVLLLRVLAPGRFARSFPPAQLAAHGHALLLNGTPTREKVIAQVHVAALYLPARESDAHKVLGADQARHLVMQFVHDVDKGKMCNAWNEALANNTPDASPE